MHRIGRASVPAEVLRVGTLDIYGSASDLRSPLFGVKHHGAEGYTNQPAPGGVTEVGAPPLPVRQLSEVYLQHPEVSVGEEEERGEAGVLFRGQDV